MMNNYGVSNNEYQNVELQNGEEQIFEEPMGNDSPKNDENKSSMGLFDWVQCLVAAVIIGIFVFIFIGRTISVDGISMMSTLYNGDRVVLSNLFYTPQNGDIVVFQNISNDFVGAPFVKRVIAIESQTVDIDFENGRVYVDGVLQCEPFINEPTRVSNQFVGPFTVSEGHVFVMGDNRNFSSDSRDSRIGEIDTRQILGRVMFVILPGGDALTSRDWSRFGTIDDQTVCPPNQGCICGA
jgi:signal peptidase I